MTVELKLGCDPEVFLHNGTNFVSAAGLFPGTKQEPHKVDKGAIQVDGLALEFNIDPAKTAEEFSGNIQTVLKQMNEMVAKVDKKLQIKFTPVARFDKKYFDELPTETKILGCDPDFRASDGNVIAGKEGLLERPLRTAAGHIHIGWTENEDAMSAVHFEDARFIANHFYQLGEWNNTLNRGYTADERERLMWYGNAGAFRPKSYGVELRQFSNLWVANPADHLRMHNYITKTVTALYKGA